MSIGHRTRLIQFRVSERQYRLILNKKENFGYRVLSQFVRDCVLRDDLASLKLIKEIHKKIVGEEVVS